MRRGAGRTEPASGRQPGIDGAAARGSAPALELRHIRKSFSGVEVLHDVSLEVWRGEVHGLVGANGAGKSTLMKIVNGVYPADSGEIAIDGRQVHFHGPAEARALGISMVFQEFSLVPTMTVAQNLLLGREPRRAGGILIDDTEAERRSREILDELAVEISPSALVGSLPVGHRQLVEIAKALLINAKIVILDEPTASLSSAEIQRLFALIRRLRDLGVAIVFISHHLQEVAAVCDRITVLRDGRVALTDRLANVTIDKVITAMVGTSTTAADEGALRAVTPGEPLLEVADLTWGDRLHSVSFSVRRGEIVGIAGLLGSGRTELLTSLFGVRRPGTGQVRVHGRPLRGANPRAAIRGGLSLVPEDRRREGLLPEASIYMNVLLPVWHRLTRWGFIDDTRGRAIVTNLITRLKVRASGVDQRVSQLSGGNQQKVVFAKALSSEPSVLLLDDPMVGVDVQSKHELRGAVRAIASRGSAVLLASSEFDELAALCNRVLILHRGSVVGELDRARGDEITEESLLRAVQETGSNVQH